MLDDPVELHSVQTAKPAAAARMRRALRAFLTTLDIPPEWAVDVLTAAGEAIANAIEHGNASGKAGNITLDARFCAPALVIEVSDCGTFIQRDPQPGRGLGLGIIRNIASDVSIESGNGTRVSMTFLLT
jgi:anti-sigma regulatory factor (Ser/Thr protein kinase)